MRWIKINEKRINLDRISGYWQNMGDLHELVIDTGKDCLIIECKNKKEVLTIIKQLDNIILDK